MRINRLTTLLASCLFAAIGAASAVSAAEPTMFPFVIEKGAPENITNIRTWDGAALEPAGSFGHITNVDGDFMTTAGRARLLGTNTCFSANFCSHEKAERLAATLSRFGIGVVRLHHMDSRDIWGKNYPNGSTEIDPDQLDKLDYLVAKFEERGIYVNINLHVSRAFREVDGFENADQLPTQNKGVDNFDRKMIEFQKKYAKDLLTHVNPYTGKAYVDDPGVAVVEINNENSVVASWSWGALDNLPEPYASEFRALWNGWLVKKYKTTDALKEAWECKSFPLGEEFVKDGDFSEGFKFNANNGWNFESDSVAKTSVRVLTPAESGLDTIALQVNIEKMGEVAWRPQFHYVALSVVKDKPYRVSFKIRANKKTKVNVGVLENHDPWGTAGFRETLSVTEEWKDVVLTFIAKTTDDVVRLSFSGFDDGETIELASVSFREGGDVGLEEGVSLEDGTVPVPRAKAQGSLSTPKESADFAEFLHDIENDYWQEMFAYVKSLGVKSLATGTQLQYGFWYNQGKLDYCDIHAYWNHPTFPHRSWDGNDWYVTNTCLANSPTSGTLANLAAVRVLGKPFTCSEYDHPYPNFYCAEGNVMLAAVAAFQDWAATFQFAWAHGDEFERDAAGSFFDMCATQTKMAHLPACYGMFVRGDVKAGPGEFVYAPAFTEEEEVDCMKGLLHDYHRSLAKGMKIDPAMSLAVFAGVELSDLNLGKSASLAAAKRVDSWKDLPEELGSPETKEITNEFKEIKWNFQQEEKGYFVVDTARSKVFSGFVTAPYDFDGLTLDIGETALGWATVSLVKAKGLVDGEAKTGVLSSGSYLLTATGDMRNTDAVYKTTNGNAVTHAGAFGGSAGHAPTLCEGVPAALTLPGVKASNVEVYALDASGARAAKVDVEALDDGARVAIGPEYKTIWYEIVVK